MEKTLDKNAPTLSRTARNFVMTVCAIKRWKVLTADVKGAFMQTDGVRAGCIVRGPRSAGRLM